MAVQSSAPVLAVTDHYLWGSSSGSESVLNELDAYSDSVDVSTYDKISVYGSSSNLSDELEFQVSHDDTNWFEMTEKFVPRDSFGEGVGEIFVSNEIFVVMRVYGLREVMYA